MTLWRTEGRNWVNRTIHNHQKSPHQSVWIFRPEPLLRFFPKIWNFHTSSCRKKTHTGTQTATLDHHNYKCSFFFSSFKHKKNDTIRLRSNDPVMTSTIVTHRVSTISPLPLSAEHTTHFSILFFSLKTSNLTFMLNFLASFQVQIWLNKTKPVTRCLQIEKKQTNNKKVRQSTDS